VRLIDATRQFSEATGSQDLIYTEKPTVIVDRLIRRGRFN
jgi:hypothetical protein